MKRVISGALDAVVWVAGELAYLLRRLLGWRNVSRLGQCVGRLMFRLRPAGRNALLRELKLIVPPDTPHSELVTIGKRCMAAHYARILETVFFGRLTGRDMDRRAHASGLANLDAALAHGKGVILLLAHYGSFLLPLPFLGHRDYHVFQVTGLQRHGSMFAESCWRWRKRDADRLPVGFIQVGKFLGPIIRSLRGNGAVAIAFDGRDGTKWIQCDFLGHGAKISAGPFSLARRTGATVIPTFTHREPDNTFRITFDKPFSLSREADNDEDAVTVDTIRYAEYFSRYVAEHPCHFGMALVRHRAAASEQTPGFFVD